MLQTYPFAQEDKNPDRRERFKKDLDAPVNEALDQGNALELS